MQEPESVRRVIERQVDFSRAALMHVADATVGVGNRLSTWLVLGNAGAFVALYGAALQYRVLFLTDGFAIASKAWALGLVLAFVGTTFSYFGNLLQLFRLARQIHPLLQVEVANSLPDPDPKTIAMRDAAYEEMQREDSFLQRYWSIILTLFLLAASAAAFGVGIWAVVTTDSVGLVIEDAGRAALLVR